MARITSIQIYIPTDTKIEIKTVKKIKIIWIAGNFGISRYIVPSVTNILPAAQILSLCQQPVFARLNSYCINLAAYLRPTTSTAINLQKLLVASSIGFKKYLRVKGVGYKFTYNKAAMLLIIKVGYSHLVAVNLHPEFELLTTRKCRMVRFKSQGLVTLINLVAKARALRKPDPYKGKGIRIRKERIKRKEGKKRRSF